MLYRLFGPTKIRRRMLCSVSGLLRKHTGMVSSKATVLFVSLTQADVRSRVSYHKLL